MTALVVDIAGPFGWPKLERDLPPLPAIPGVYLMTVQHLDGFLPYGVGITRRAMRSRFVEHARSYIAGNYNILDLEAAQQGTRRVVWKGWGWTPEKLADFGVRKAGIADMARRQMTGTRIFVLDVGTTPRLLERMEGAIANHYYKSDTTLFDRGMLCMPRWDSEEPLTASFRVGPTLYGLPTGMVI